MSALVLFAPNAGPGIGGGHVLRCLSWATALHARGAEIAFAAPQTGLRLIERFAEVPVEALAAHDFTQVLEHARRRRPAAVVVDHYGWGPEEEARLAPLTGCPAALDDLARVHAADLVLDPSFGRRAADYAGRVSASAHLLLGPDYALLRPMFAARRGAAFALVKATVERVFVSFGLSDVGGVALRAAEVARRVLPEAKIDLALAADAESRPALERLAAADSRLRLHVDAREVAALMAEADLGIGAGGSATWERSCLGLPTLAVVVAENQRTLMADLDQADALLTADLNSPAFDAEFADALDRLRAPELRARLRERSRSLCDGLGAERAADALLSLLQAERG